MIQLTLSSQEADLLHHSLLAFQQLSPEQAADAHSLLQKIQHSLLDIDHNQCPICHTSFSQNMAGRDALYCSKACKQKAYRQRVNDRKRHFGPPRAE